MCFISATLCRVIVATRLHMQQTKSQTSQGGLGIVSSLPPFILKTPREILVGGFKHFLFSISYMGCHPNPIDELIFFKMVIAPPTSR